MNFNQYNKLKGRKPEVNTLQAITFAISEEERKLERSRKKNTKGAFGKSNKTKK